jgi:hypothetical protein
MARIFFFTGISDALQGWALLRVNLLLGETISVLEFWKTGNCIDAENAGQPSKSKRVELLPLFARATHNEGG